jgi:hypothetical protein
MKALPLALGVLGTAFLLSRRASAATAPSGWGELSRLPTMRPDSYISTSERDQRFGPIEWRHSPTGSNPEAVTILNDFPRRLVKRRYLELPGSPLILIHEDAAGPLEAVLDALDARGELGLIRAFDGVYNPRLVRGSSSNLSSHAYGTSIDLNAAENPLGSAPTLAQKRLAEVFESHGWYWGDRFARRDPMHFEWIG